MATIETKANSLTGSARWKPRASELWLALNRGQAWFWGLFSPINLLGEIRFSGFDASIWWIDTRLLPQSATWLLLTAWTMFVLAFAIRPKSSVWRQRVTAGLMMATIAISIQNSFVFWRLVDAQRISTNSHIPFSMYVMLFHSMLLSSVVMTRQPRVEPSLSRITRLSVTMAGMLSCLIGFPLAQMKCFGETSYQRKADAVVVLGCRAFADGRLSWPLYERVKAGCKLYQEGVVDKVIFSGGPGDGDIHETEAMRQAAIKLGVSDADIICDRGGWNTRLTAENTAQLFQQHGLRRILAVSHFYHLPRIKLSYHRVGIDVYTVPANMRYKKYLRLTMMREVAALWLYYVRPLAIGK